MIQRPPLVRSGLMLLCLGATAMAVEVGMTRTALIAELGPPESRMETAGRAIFRWDAVEVHLQDDHVRQIHWRDLAAERAANERRARLDEQQRQHEAEAARLQQEAAARAAAEAERLRPERERAELAARIARLEREKQAAEAKAAELAAAAARERKVRILILQRESAAALSALRAANAQGDEKQARYLRRVWLAKEAELKLLRDTP